MVNALYDAIHTTAVRIREELGAVEKMAYQAPTKGFDHRFATEELARYREVLHRTVVACMKREILDDIESGVLPSNVRTFADLHDYTDANLYGNAEQILDVLGPDAEVDIFNRASNEIDQWLKGGRQ
jgi:hypothetical protein